MNNWHKKMDEAKYYLKVVTANKILDREVVEKCYNIVKNYSKIPIIRPPLRLSKVVLKTTFGQSQRWSLIRCTLVGENEEKNSFKFQNKVFNG